MRVVAEMGRVLVSTLDESRVLEIVTTQAYESLGKLDIAIWLQESAGGPLRLVAGQGPFSSPLAARARRSTPDEGVVGRALSDRAPVWTADVLQRSAHPAPPGIAALDRGDRRPVHPRGAAHPGAPAGRARRVSPRRARRSASREVEYLVAFANQIAVALENARLYQALDARVRELSVLHELSRSVTGQLDQAGILDTLHQQVPRVLDVRHMAVVLLDDEQDRLNVVLRVRDGLRCDEDEPRSYPRSASPASPPSCCETRPADPERRLPRATA